MTPFYRKDNGMRYGGLGANIISQQAGPNGLYKATGFTGTFAYTIHLSRAHHIGAGIGAGIINKRVDASAITTASQYNLGYYDPSLANGENIQSNSVTRPVINAGLAWSFTDANDQQKATLGVAAYSMNQPSFGLLEDAASDKTTYVVSGEVAVLSSDRITLSPTFRYLYQGASVANVGARVSYILDAASNELSAGLWYKTTKALVFGAQYNYKAYVIGASMDLSVASNRDANFNNAFEIVLGWRMNKKERVKARRAANPSSNTSATDKQKSDTAKSSDKDTTETQEAEVVEPAAQPEPAKTEPARTTTEPAAPAPKPAQTQTQPAQSNNTNTGKTTPAAEESKPQPEEIPTVQFKLGSNEVSEESEAALEKLAEELKSHPDYKLKITGHTCSLGSRAVNDKVSYRRANAVAKILRDKGVPASQLEVIGMADRKPIASNATRAGRQMNRRVELEWIKK